MTFEKKIYELSLWDDGPDGEVRRCTIASNTMSSPARAFNINLNKKANGEKTLTFSIYAKYFDQEICDYVTNPYLGFLTNERKVKLKKEEKGQIVWYDMIIKQVSEDSSNFTYTYTAKDQHIQELAKSGFELEFDKELKNNTGTKEELAQKILEGTDWGIEQKESLREYTKEPVSRGCVVEDPNLLFVPVLEPTATPVSLQGKYVYVTYFFTKESRGEVQVLYNPQDCKEDMLSELTDEGVLVRNKYQIYIPTDSSLDCSEIFYDNPILCSGIQGERLVHSQKTVYDDALGQYVKVYGNNEGKEIYGFTKTEYITPELVENLITNGEGDFTSTAGWYSTTTATRELSFFPDVKDWRVEEQVTSYIRGKPEKNVSYPWSIMNGGLFDNRGKISGFTKGQSYILKWKLKNPHPLQQAIVCEYEIKDGRYKPKENGLVLFQSQAGPSSPSSPLILSCETTITEEEIRKKKIGIFLFFTFQGHDSVVELERCQFYRDIGVEPGQIPTLETGDLVKTHYYYYDPQKAYTKFEDIEFEYEGYEEQTEVYVPVYNPTFEKRRTITGKESNRYNLLQEICEQFECWMDIEVNHNTAGAIENFEGKDYSKRIVFREFIGKDNYAGFKYGINLKSIKRKVDSDQIVTKMVVKDNTNEFGKNGFCSIARAPSNPSGTNVVYNFDYYIGQNLLHSKDVSKALYLTSNIEPIVPDLSASLDEESWNNLSDINFIPDGQAEDWGLYPKLDYITSKTQTIAEEQIGISKNLTSLKASIDFEQSRLDGAESSLIELEEDLEKLTGYTYNDFLQNPNPTKVTEVEGQELSEEQKEWNRFVDWALSEKVLEYKVKIRHLRIEAKLAGDKLNELQNPEGELSKFQSEYDLNTKRLKYYNTQRKKIEQKFNQDYARFIQEGPWISEDYIDDELYYLDALATGYTSSRPKVTYTIDVFDLAGVEDCENYRFDIGDKTFVEDGEFFGYVEDKIIDPISKEEIVLKRPHREEVVINELTEGIDDITKNTLKVQNYKSQFDDLFQRITASVESLQYNTGRYERGAKVVESNGAISHKALQQAVNENGLAINNAGAQTVTIDEQGVITTDKALPNKKVRIIGGGIYVTKDGGETWETGITGDGINANVITTGQLNAGEINIMTGDVASHRWDDKGITAYKTNYATDGTDYQILSVNSSSFVRFDEFGLYGIQNNANFDARSADNKGDGLKYGIEKIQRDSIFSLTQDALTIGQNGYGLRADANGVTIGPGGVMKMGFDEGVPQISIGEGFIAKEDGLTIAGWKVNEKSLAYGQVQDPDTFAWSHGTFFISPGGLEETDISGNSESNKQQYSIYSKGNFGITAGGILHAQGAQISGTIKADSGYIGGIEISSGGIFSKPASKIVNPTGGNFTIEQDSEFDITIYEDPQSTVYWYSNQENDITITIKASTTFSWYITTDIIQSTAEVLGTHVISGYGTSSNIVTLPSRHTLLVEPNYNATCELTITDMPDFSLTSDGYLYAQNANISGTIEANNGTIGNIKIEDGGLVSKSTEDGLIFDEIIQHGTIYLSSTSIQIKNWKTGGRQVKYYKASKDVTINFALSDSNGTIVAVLPEKPTGNKTYYGISAIYGKSGIKPIHISKESYILVSSSGDEPQRTVAGGFTISSDGTIQAEGAIIKNLILNGNVGVSGGATIAGWSIDSTGLYASSNFYLAPNGKNGVESSPIFQCGDNFNIKTNGNVGIGPNDTWTITDTRIKTEGVLENVNMVFPSGPQTIGLPVGGTYLGYLQYPGLLNEKYPQAFLGIRRTTKDDDNNDVYDYPLFISYTGLIKASTVVFHNEYANEPSRVLVFNTDNTVTWKEWSVPW